MEYGTRLREYRKNAGVTQEELAAEIERARSQVSRYESGDLKLTRPRLAELVFAIEKIVERRGKAADPATVLEVT